MTSKGNGEEAAFFGICSSASRRLSTPTLIRPDAEVLTSVRGRALSRPSFGNPNPLTPLQLASSISDAATPPLNRQNSRRLKFVPRTFIFFRGLDHTTDCEAIELLEYRIVIVVVLLLFAVSP